MLKPEMSVLRDVVERFFNEARAAASVRHPGVVQIHNVGYHGDRAYLLMERLHKRVSQKWLGDPLAKVAADTNVHILPDSTISGCYQVR